jgi:hypothetical protein
VTRAALGSGVATSLGSLPHVDPATAAAMVLAAQPALPAAPSLPRRSPAESMLGQAAAGVAGVELGPDGRLVADLAQLDPTAPVGDATCDGDAFVALRAFLDAKAAAGHAGAVKLQLTGPVTFALALHAAGVPMEIAAPVAAAAAGERADALVACAQRALPDAPLVVFVDEPGFTAVSHPTFPLGIDEAVDLVSGVLARLAPHALTGVHCCGHTDWRAVLAAGPDILSLPVARSDDLSADDLDAFLARDGIVAWGAVPTDRPIGDGPELLWRELAGRWCELVRGGCDGARLRAQSMITPACGLATHDETQAARVLDLANRLAERLAGEALGIRLTVGA